MAPSGTTLLPPEDPGPICYANLTTALTSELDPLQKDTGDDVTQTNR